MPLAAQTCAHRAPPANSLEFFLKVAKLERWQVNAARRFERDLSGVSSGSSNAAAIYRHLQTSLKPTAAQAKAQTFGQLMRGCSPTSSAPVGVERLIGAAQQLQALRMRVPVEAWVLLDFLIKHNKSVADIARAWKKSPPGVAGLVREALADLAAAYDELDREEYA